MLEYRPSMESVMSRTAPNARAGWNEKLSDGAAVWIRPVSRQDAGLELEFLRGLSPEFRALRFLGLVREPCPEVARELTELDPANAAGFIALVTHEGHEREIGAAHFRTNMAGDSCDCSVTVSEDWQKHGVGSLLMHRLIEVARVRRIQHMRAVAPASSEGSRELASHLGFDRRQDPRDPAAMIYHLDLR